MPDVKMKGLLILDIILVFCKSGMCCAEEEYDGDGIESHMDPRLARTEIVWKWWGMLLEYCGVLATWQNGSRRVVDFDLAQDATRW
jgi:hypothetical protein